MEKVQSVMDLMMRYQEIAIFGRIFQIYIPQEDMPIYGERLKQRLNTLPKTFQGFGARIESQYGDGRVGVFSIEDFY
ncbi:MAG: hypothetical protein ACLTS6_06485 [Anaerobutyricum sp.]